MSGSWPVHQPGLSASAILARAVAVATGTALLVAASLAALTPSGVDRIGAAAGDGKLADRLSFTEEDVPARETRIYDTLAMFGLKVSEPGTWSETPVPTASPLRVAQAPSPAHVTPALPRMVQAVNATAPRHPSPAPAAIGKPVAAPVVAQVVAIASSESTEPTPIRLVGWDIPGSQHLPDRRDAGRAVGYVGGKAVALGSGVVSVVSDGASLVGETASSVGSGLAMTVGLR